VLTVGLIETVMLAVVAAVMLDPVDPFGANIGRLFVLVIAAPYDLLTLPCVVLAFMGRWLPLAFTLVLLAVPVTLAIWSA
jgi:hypothetical protein